MRICPTCRTRYPDEVTFCPKDGLLLVEVTQTIARGSSEEPALLPTQLEVGMMVGEFRIERHIATGGMGAIYAGIHPVISKRVAIKVLNRGLSRDPRTLSRFVLEARAVNKIGHHNIVDIFSIGEFDDGRAYLVMELLDGLPLNHLLSRAGKLTPGHVLLIYQQLCDALQAAHDKGFIHRDLKPDNIVVLRRPPRPFVKILDFGIAKLRDEEASQNEATAVGTILGTPEYMSPEQCLGQEITVQSDIYALGIMLYEFISGTKPFYDPSPMRVLAAQLRSPPPPLPNKADLPTRLEAVILQAMAKDPAMRFSSATELLEALSQAVGTAKPWDLDLSPLNATRPSPAEAAPDKATPDKAASDKAVPEKVATDEAPTAPSGDDPPRSLPRAAPRPSGLHDASIPDVPAPLQMSGEFSFGADELGLLPSDEEDQTVTAVVSPPLLAHAAAQDLPPQTHEAKDTPAAPARAESPLPPTAHAGLIRPAMSALAPEPLADASHAPLPDFLSDDGANIEFLPPDDFAIASTAIEESFSLSTSELVIERSLLDQTEQARSAYQATFLRQTDKEETVDDAVQSINPSKKTPTEKTPTEKTPEGEDADREDADREDADREDADREDADREDAGRGNLEDEGDDSLANRRIGLAEGLSIPKVVGPGARDKVRRDP